MNGSAYLIIATLCLLHASCMPNCTDPICLHYTPISAVPTKKIKESSVIVQYAEPSQISSMDKSIKSGGAMLIGRCRFNHGFTNFNSEIKKQAAMVGAKRVVYTQRKVGKAQGDQMILAAQTSPTFGVNTTNTFGSIVTGYGSSSYSGSGVGTNYQSGQSLHVRKEFMYDVYEFDVRFYR